MSGNSGSAGRRVMPLLEKNELPHEQGTLTDRCVSPEPGERLQVAGPTSASVRTLSTMQGEPNDIQ